MLHKLFHRLRKHLLKEKTEREMDAEMRFHLEMETEKNIRRGMSEKEARLAARRSFGGIEQTKEAYRDFTRFRWLEEVWQDLRYGARMLLKNPGATLITVITLSLGIGANTAIFSIINGILLRPLPYKDPERLVMVWATRPPNQEFPFSSTNFIDLRNQNQAFEQVAAFGSQPLNLTGRGDPEFPGSVFASANLFSLLGVGALHGRLFLPEEEQPGNHRVVIISYGLWQRRFGSDPKIVGQTISLNDEPYTVVGIMPQGFQFPRKGDLTYHLHAYIPSVVDIYVPTAFAPEQWNNRKAVSVVVIARLKPEFSLEQAQAEMNGFALRLQQQSPDTRRDHGIRLGSYHQQVVSRVKLALLVLLGAVGFVLLIACTNVANLMLVRATARRKEMAIRSALGAGRGRVVRQLLTESILLAVLSGSLAVLVAFWGIDLLQLVIPDNLPRADEIGIDGRVFGFTLLISLLTGILFGLVPALQASRLSLSNVLKEGGRSSVSHHHLRNLLVVSEVALALVLLIGAGLMLRSFMKLTSVDPGLDTKNILTANIRLPRSRYPAPQQAAFYRQLLERLRVTPGVEAASAAFPLPLSGAEEGIGFDIEGGPPHASGQRNIARPRCVGTDYFKTLNIQLQRGRVFRESDSIDAPPVVIINEVLARQYWPNQDPIGKRMVVDIGPGWREVIGVVKSVRHMGLDDELHPELYFPVAQFPWPNLTLVVRTNGEPLNFVGAVRNQIQAIDKDQPISNIHTMDDLLARTVSQPRFNLILLAIFAGIALLLAAIGIYGVVSYLVAERTHEIGIRMALGAQTRDVLKLVVKQGLTLVIIGIAIGLIAAFGLTRLMKSLLFGVSTTDPLTFAIIVLSLIIVALLACWTPARRAAKVDPLLSLRHE
jgi:predicted permease